MKKRRIIIIIGSIITISILFLCFKNPILRPFKKEKHLNYQNINSVEIFYSNRDSIKINTNEEVEKIVNYINSLTLINEDDPRNSEYITDYNDYIENHEYITIYIDCDALTFSTKYLSVNLNGQCDCVYTDYYIKNSGFNNKDGSSRTSKFLEGVIEDYKQHTITPT